MESKLSICTMAFSYGLAALLTPGVGLQLIISYVAIGKIATDVSSSRRNAIIFGVGSFLLFVLFSNVLVSLVGHTTLVTNPFVDAVRTVLFAVFILFGLWFIGMFEDLLTNLQTDSTFIALVVFANIILFFASSFTSAAPIIGSVLVESADGSLTTSFLAMTFFGLGITLPTFLLIFLSVKLFQKWKESKRWINFQKIVGVLIIILSFYSYFFKHLSDLF